MRRRRFSTLPQRRSLMRQAPGVVLALVFIALAGFFSAGDLIKSVTATARGCNIAGNISINRREKIFHVPGQEDYAATRISPQYGERWFCSEAEAVAAGFRKARN
jgi:hypothetical protein